MILSVVLAGFPAEFQAKIASRISPKVLHRVLQEILLEYLHRFVHGIIQKFLQTYFLSISASTYSVQNFSRDFSASAQKRLCLCFYFIHPEFAAKVIQEFIRFFFQDLFLKYLKSIPPGIFQEVFSLIS